MPKGQARVYTKHKPRCNAKSKQTQEQCAASAVEGKDKCHWHGGRIPFKTDGSRSKYKSTLPTLKSQRKKIDADPKLISSDELLKKHVTIVNQLYDDLSKDLDSEPCFLCGHLGGNLLDHPALRPLLDNLATAVTRASAIEELKVKKGYVLTLTELNNFLLKRLLPAVEDLLLPGGMKKLQHRLSDVIDVETE